MKASFDVEPEISFPDSDIGFTFFDEFHFHHIVEREKKRCRRHGRLCILMTIPISFLANSSKKKRKDFISDSVRPYLLIKKLIKEIGNSTREIDMKGWYSANKIIGILFTEVDDKDIEHLKTKLQTNVYAVLPNIMLKDIQLTCERLDS